MEYITVEREASDEFIEKKSRFIGACRPVKTEEEALRFIQEKSPAIGTPPQCVRLHSAGGEHRPLL